MAEQGKGGRFERRVLTAEECQTAREMRASGSSYRTISAALKCHFGKVSALLGPAPRLPAWTDGGIRKAKQRERARLFQGRPTEARTAENGFALPAGSPETWGAISDQPFTPRSSIYD